jgi:sterol 3beta-glucosyltransferase
VTGCFFLEDEAYQPPAELVDFLEKDGHPVCNSFGSMVNRSFEKTHRILLETFSATKDHAIVLTGWGGIQPEALSENILYLNAVPHAWLFPRCKTIIHHGGAGTTAAARIALT